MSKRISSSDWTGPPGLEPRFGAFTHRIDQHSIASDYQRIQEAQRAAAAIPPEVRAGRRLAMLLLLSPVSLWLAWLLVGFATHDVMVRSHGSFLVLWGLSVMALAAWQLQSRSVVLIGLRKAFLSAACAATIAVSIAFAYFGIDAYAHAIARAPERSFELYKVYGRRSFKHVVYWHQRPDGTTVEGFNHGRALPYAQTCALVQRLDGRYGFSWVRVLDRSRAPRRGQLIWPVRREECFSSIPLSSLPR